MDFAVATWEKMSLFVDDEEGAGAVELSSTRDSVVEYVMPPCQGSVQQAELTDAEKDDGTASAAGAPVARWCSSSSSR